LCNILITHRIHTACHISLTLQQFLVMRRNCSCNKLHVTAVSYRDSRTESILRLSPISGIHQKATESTTYLLTPWFRVLLEKLTGLQLVKKFPAFHGTRRFITALTSVRHMSLSWASPIQSMYLVSYLFVCCAKIPLETLLPGDPSGGVVYLRIVLCPEESSRL